MDTLLDKCNKLGLKMTEQRKVIVRVLSDSQTIQTLSQCIKELRKLIRELALPLFTEQLNYLRDNNLLEKHEFKGYSSRYETVRENHHHLIDVRSGKK